MAIKDPIRRKAYNKAWRALHKDYNKAYMKAYMKAYRAVHKEEYKAYTKEYRKSDLNSLSQPKESIRCKSRYLLKQMHLHIDGYQIHHCFGYEDASKFIYISKALHVKIHKYLRDNNISADSNHWMQIRDLINNTEEFTYIKC